MASFSYGEIGRVCSEPLQVAHLHLRLGIRVKLRKVDLQGFLGESPVRAPVALEPPHDHQPLNRGIICLDLAWSGRFDQGVDVLFVPWRHFGVVVFLEVEFPVFFQFQSALAAGKKAVDMIEEKVISPQVFLLEQFTLISEVKGRLVSITGRRGGNVKKQTSSWKGENNNKGLLVLRDLAFNVNLEMVSHLFGILGKEWAQRTWEHISLSFPLRKGGFWGRDSRVLRRDGHLCQ